MNPPVPNKGNIHFIIVKPEFPGNLGSIARVLKNFGFTNLRLIQPPATYKDSDARRMSAGAFDLLKNCKIFADLASALADISMAFGTTAAQYRNEKPISLPGVLDDLIQASCQNQVAIVFGNERNGLSKEDLQRCHKRIIIPSNPDFPSLNVSHAVAVVAYEATRNQDLVSNHERNLISEAADLVRPDGNTDDELFIQTGKLFDRIGFSRSFNRTKVLTELRVVYQRTLPTQREHSLLMGFLQKVNYTLDQLTD